MRTNFPRSSGKLYALALAIEADAVREPYPRLAQLMQHLAMRESMSRSSAARLTYN